jgi:hypothetical protein
MRGMADALWRAFRRWPWWAQAVGWLIGWWLLIPALAWRTGWHWGIKTAITAVCALLIIALAARTSGGRSSPKRRAAARPAVGAAVTVTATRTPTLMALPSSSLLPSPTPSPTRTPSPPPTLSPTHAATPRQAPSPTVPPATTGFTGLGATRAQWETRHRPAFGTTPGSAYDPINCPDGHSFPRYAALDWNERTGILVGLTIQYCSPDGVPISVALRDVAALLPPDATVVGHVLALEADGSSTCETFYRSATFGRVAADPALGDPDGVVSAAFSSPNFTDPFSFGLYNPQHVIETSVSLGSMPDGLRPGPC